MHELCNFEDTYSHEEMLGSIILESVVEFDTGADAGLRPHEKEAFRIQNAALGKKVKIEDPTVTKPFFSYQVNTSEFVDYTIILTLPHRVLTLRCETKTSFDSWKMVIGKAVPNNLKIKSQHEGWMWRQKALNWAQRYALIYDGVLYFFESMDKVDHFKLLASRNDDSIFVANQCVEAYVNRSNP